MGAVSLHYTLIAFGSELIQDFASHTLAHVAADRHPNSANFTAVCLLHASLPLVPRS
jgi:hypothetical protein